MISRVYSFVLQGIDAVRCEIEADLTRPGTRKTAIVGLPDAAVKESVDRVRTAILNSGYAFPRGRLTINLAPAHLRKHDQPGPGPPAQGRARLRPAHRGGGSQGGGHDRELGGRA
ncbi:MAG: magnesium chelatase domain-containing protein [Planctomycetota bacterium]